MKVVELQNSYLDQVLKIGKWKKFLVLISIRYEEPSEEQRRRSYKEKKPTEKSNKIITPYKSFNDYLDDLRTVLADEYNLKDLSEKDILEMGNKVDSFLKIMLVSFKNKNI